MSDRTRILLTEALAYALDFAPTRSPTRALARTLARALARARTRDITSNYSLARALDLAHTHARALGHARTLDLARDLDLAGNLARDLDLARNLARDITRDLDFALDRDRDRTRNRDLDRDLDLARDLDRAVVVYSRLIKLLMHTELGVPPREGSARSAVVVSPAAQRVTTLVVQLLPAGCRAVKAEELAAELHDIAVAGGPRRRQLAHALRVLATIVPLRRALSVSGRRAAERG
ncbi:MAG: hypothetical protein HOY79_31345 [Streptomyces sp.]|nr:hypothetical protein [Streptomyces sp.]